MKSFARPADLVDVTVLVVTFNSSDRIGGLIESLREEAAELSLRVVVADNSSTDSTVARLGQEDDVVVVPTGGNLGYSGGINVAAAHAGEARAILILNPDLRVEQGAVRALLTAMKTRPNAGIIVPRILDDGGDLTPSLHNEPALLRALTDALLGPVWKKRPAAFSEWVRNPAEYTTAHRTDWATGAALLVSAKAAQVVGEWDERFFLYSEETDYCRRVRDAGYEVWFEPSATVHHSQGGSGSSPQLDALRTVNRVRYMRKHAPRVAPLYRWVAWLGAALRSHNSASHRLSATMLQNERRWVQLPSSTPGGAAR